MNKFTSFFCFLFFCISAWAQDSIVIYETQLPKTIGVEKVKTLNSLIYLYQNDSLSKSVHYAEQALLLIDSIKNKELAGEILLNIAKTYRLVGDTKKALYYFKAAYWYFSDSDNLTKKAEIIDNLGIIYRYIGYYDYSLNYHLKALSLYNNIKNKSGIISAINNIGIVYRNLGQNDLARNFYLYALKLNQTQTDEYEEAVTLTNIGNIDWYEGKYVQALKNYNAALDITLIVNDINKTCGLLNNIGNVLRDSGNLVDALKNYQKALLVNKKHGDKNLEAVIYKNIGITYYKRNENDSALLFFNKSLDLVLKGNLTRFEKDIYLNISNCYSNKKDFEKAFYFFKLYTEYQDSLINEKTYKKIANINQQYQTQQRENQIYKIDLKRKQLTIYIFILIIIAGFLSIIIIYNQYWQKRKTTKLLLSEIEERKKAEYKIHIQNIEIQSQYEELMSSNEELMKINSQIEEKNSIISQDEERFRSLFENSSDGLFLMTETISDCNIKACELFDLRKEDIIGLSPADLSPATQPNGRNSEVMVTEYINFALRGNTVQYTWKHKRKDGLLIDCEITLIPINIKNDQVIYTKIVDITERIRSELRLKESEEKYSSLVNQVPIGIYRTNSEGIILYGNPALVKMLGYESINELLNVNIKTFYVNLDERKKQQDYWINLKTNIISSDEFQVRRKDGSIIWVRFTDHAVIDKSGEINYFSGIMEDITDQKAAEEKITRLIVNFPGVVYRSLMGNASCMLFMSDETRHLTGFEPEEFVNKKISFYDIIHPADRKFVFDTINNAIKIKERYILNYRLITKEGNLKWVHEQGYAIQESKNNTYELEGIIIDINERKQAEEVLKESEEKYRSLVEDISEALFSVSTHGYITYFSPKVEKITGYTVNEIIGKHFSDFIYKDDLNKLNTSMRRSLSGAYSPAEFRVIDKSGAIKYIKTSSSLVKKDGNIVGLSGIMTDITEQKHAEKIQALLFNISQAANYAQSIDEFYVTLYANLKEVIKTDNFYIALYNKIDDTVTFPFFKDIKDDHPGTRKFGNGLTEFVIKSKVPLLKDEVGLKEMYENGECEQILSVAKSWLGVPLKTQDEVIGVMVIQSYSEDIKFGETEKGILIYCSEQIAMVLQQKRNEELKRNVELAEKTSQIKQQFLANMSHEMRTPMNGILGMVDFLLQTKLDEKQLDFAKTIKNSSETLLNLINDILDLSKIDAGTMKIIPCEFNIHKLLKEVVSLFKASIEQKGLAVNLFYSNDVPDYIVADKNRVNQIINNLLSNAIKFTDKGSISIRVSKVQEDDESNLVEKDQTDKKNVKIKVEVKDTGIGINPDNQSGLFTLFGQIDSTYTRNYEGTGLGLAISKKLVEMMGGEIGVISEPGKGSTFWFTIEAFPITDAAITKISKVKPEYKKQVFNIKILLVEDKFINQKVVTMMLQNVGCKTVIANNGIEALEIFEKEKFDLVLMDIQMPLMDGVTAVKELQKKYTQLPPIIGLSANAMEGDAEKYIAEGMDDYLSKPVSAEQLYEKIARWLARKK